MGAAETRRGQTMCFQLDEEKLDAPSENMSLPKGSRNLLPLFPEKKAAHSYEAP